MIKRGLRPNLDVKAFAIFLVLMLFFAIFLFYPIAYMFNAAFVVQGRFSTIFFQLMFTDTFYNEALLNSILIGLFSTILTAAFSLPLAFVLVRYSFRAKTLLQGLLLVPLVMPPFVGAIGMKQIFARYGSFNLLLIQLGLMSPSNPFDWFGGGFWGIIIMEVLHLYPIMYLSLAGALPMSTRVWRKLRRASAPEVWQCSGRSLFLLHFPASLQVQ